MNLKFARPNCRLPCVVLAAALSLAACGEKPPAETVIAKMETAAEIAARQAKQAAAEQKKAEEAKPKTDPKAAADGALAAKVKAAILAAPGLKNMAMDVRAADGNVGLFGTADNDAQRRQAEKVAAGVAGVKSVKNELHIVRGS